ncbi:hypothetical protein J437_LFUL006220 [Ladona fulva]|uniref:Uncharacterized protein n=1 Tax=Ladona fulva TaxID=123851 RepID=A0A8K0K3T7_LADFU|nr:hypothetical protein J437_LFUL006220 [Ladona fulva]
MSSDKQLIAVRRLESFSGSREAQAVWNAIVDWNLEDKVQFFCCDTTASNTQICLFLRQVKSFVYELVLKSVFEVKISQVTTNPDIPLFKKFRDNWKSLYRTELTKEIARLDFRELIEHSVIFLGGDTQRKFEILPPGAMHQTP